MLLAIDIGNTNIVLGLYADNAWQHKWRVETSVSKMADEYRVLFQQLFSHEQLAPSNISQIIISSVVPQLTHSISDALKLMTGCNAHIVSHNSHRHFKVETSNPEATGRDLIVNGIAAYHQFKQDCIVVDFGTATTVMAIAAPGILLGGSISAGINTTLNALVSKTSQLPQIALTPPNSIIGPDTISAMQSGLVVGHLAMIEGLITRFKAERLAGAKVVATGGMSNVLAQYTDCFDAVEPWLTLDGLRIIAEQLS